MYRNNPFKKMTSGNKGSSKRKTMLLLACLTLSSVYVLLALFARDTEYHRMAEAMFLPAGFVLVSLIDKTKRAGC